MGVRRETELQNILKQLEEISEEVSSAGSDKDLARRKSIEANKLLDLPILRGNEGRVMTAIARGEKNSVVIRSN